MRHDSDLINLSILHANIRIVCKTVHYADVVTGCYFALIYNKKL